MSGDKLILMLFSYMAVNVPLFAWLILGGSGSIDIEPGLFDTITYILVGITILMLFVIMPFVILPRLLNSEQEESTGKKPEWKDPDFRG
ncbi:MAG: hypothetical protein R6U39_01420 [Candidatus Aegiribacteria sp.]